MMRESGDTLGGALRMERISLYASEREADAVARAAPRRSVARHSKLLPDGSRIRRQAS
jgi:hypothetical protein